MLPELPDDPQTVIVSAVSGMASTAQYLAVNFGTALVILLIPALRRARTDVSWITPLGVTNAVGRLRGHTAACM